MKIEKIVLSYISENCYLVSTDKTAIVIDPGCYDERIEDFLISNQNKERMILLTHCHFDHIGAAKRFSETTGVKIGIGKLDNDGLSDANINLSKLFGQSISPFNADVLFEDEDAYNIGDINFSVLHTPGHTKGSVCYYMDGVLFSGDTVFKGTYGRTDFPTGSSSEIVKSFYRLVSELPDSTVIYSGHGEETTVFEEKENNPINDMSVL